MANPEGQKNHVLPHFTVTVVGKIPLLLLFMRPLSEASKRDCPAGQVC